MNFIIHRGTQEIGGTCVEVSTDKTRILLDFGIPLVDKNGHEFNFTKHQDHSIDQLVKDGILPDVKGLYKEGSIPIDGVVISHAHQDHYGLINFINPKVEFFMGEATSKIIQLNNLFTPQNLKIAKTNFFQNQKPFQIGDFTIVCLQPKVDQLPDYQLEVFGSRCFFLLLISIRTTNPSFQESA